MVSQADKEFVQAMGSRTSNNINLGTGSDFGEELLKIREKAIKQKAIAETLGIDLGEKKEGSDLAANIVTTALNKMESVQNQLAEEKKAAQESAAQAYQEADQIKTLFFQQQIQALTKLQEELKKQMEELKSGGNPKNMVDQFQQIMQLLDYIEKRRPVQPETTAQPQKSPLNFSDQIELLKLQHQHELEMKKLELQIQQQQKEFELRMLQFKEDAERRWAEYRDSMEYRKRGLEGFKDIATALTASVENEMGGGNIASPASPGETIQASVKSFPCQFCGSTIEIPPDATTVKCSKEGCNAEYEIKTKEM